MKTIEEAKNHLKQNWHQGVKCPCCEQFVKLYKRKLNTGMAYGLIQIYKLGNGWFHIPTEFTKRKINASDTEYYKLKYWGLIEQKENTDTAKKDSGIWRISQKGIDFVKCNIRLPKYVYLFNSKEYGFSEETTNIKYALGNKFNYSELMSKLL